MAKITAAEVNKLRQTTGAGMMDCKKALVEAEGDFEKAIEILRKKGQKVAANRSDRESTEGAAVAFVNADCTKGAAITLACETDFVGKNESFVALANQLVEKAIDFNSKEEFLNAAFDGSMSVSEKLIEQTGVIGEKIEIGGFEVLEGAFVGSYVHSGKIAALTALSEKVDNAEEIAKNVAMQVAAMNPIALNGDAVDTSVVEKEKEIAREQLLAEGKPENIIENILVGKVQRFFKDNTLVKQDYIKDSSMSVEKYVDGESKGLTVTGFKRVAIG